MSKIYVIKGTRENEESRVIPISDRVARVRAFENKSLFYIVKNILEKEGVKYAFSKSQFLELSAQNNWQQNLKDLDQVLEDAEYFQTHDNKQYFVIFDETGDWGRFKINKFNIDKYVYRIVD